jgi:hypothetical protein
MRAMIAEERRQRLRDAYNPPVATLLPGGSGALAAGPEVGRPGR